MEYGHFPQELCFPYPEPQHSESLVWFNDKYCVEQLLLLLLLQRNDDDKYGDVDDDADNDDNNDLLWINNNNNCWWIKNLIKATTILCRNIILSISIFNEVIPLHNPSLNYTITQSFFKLYKLIL